MSTRENDHQTAPNDKMRIPLLFRIAENDFSQRNVSHRDPQPAALRDNRSCREKGSLRKEDIQNRLETESRKVQERDVTMSPAPADERSVSPREIPWSSQPRRAIFLRDVEMLGETCLRTTMVRSRDPYTSETH